MLLKVSRGGGEVGKHTAGVHLAVPGQPEEAATCHTEGGVSSGGKRSGLFRGRLLRDLSVVGGFGCSLLGVTGQVLKPRVQASLLLGAEIHVTGLVSVADGGEGIAGGADGELLLRGVGHQGFHVALIALGEGGIDADADSCLPQHTDALAGAGESIGNAAQIPVGFGSRAIEGHVDTLGGMLLEALHDLGRNQGCVGIHRNDNPHFDDFTVDVNKIGTEHRLAACQKQVDHTRLDSLAGDMQPFLGGQLIPSLPLLLS